MTPLLHLHDPRVPHRTVSTAATQEICRTTTTNPRPSAVDALSRRRGQANLTLVCRIDSHCRRLLWVGRGRRAETGQGGFSTAGAPGRCARRARRGPTSSTGWYSMLQFCVPRRPQSKETHTVKYLLIVVLTLAVLSSSPASPQTQSIAGELPQTTAQQIRTLLEAKARRTSDLRKVSPRLLDALTVAGRESPRTDLPRLRQPVVADASGRIAVDIRATVTAEVLDHIANLGGTVLSRVPQYRAIRARLPFDLETVEALATLADVQAIRIADPAITRSQPRPFQVPGPESAPTGKMDTSEGDVAHQAFLARQRYGVDGTGIAVGVLSDGVDSLADRQASGDLPAQVTVLPGQAGEGDEGTAMLEIVHDLAPGAALYFATAATGPARFAANIRALCDAGVDVIVDDIFYLTEPAFQDGVIAQQVTAATRVGCAYFSAAGNGGNLNDRTAGVWEGNYHATVLSDGWAVHDFNSGNAVVENTITCDGPAFILQWADPRGAADNDYDLFLIDTDGNVVDFSADRQDGTQDPIEIIRSWGVDDSGYGLVVVKTSGEGRYLRLDTVRGHLAVATAGSTVGHAASADAIGVAQVDVMEAAGAGGMFNGTEPVIPASSDGPRRMFFDSDGTPITPSDFSASGGRIVQKPDVTAASCVATSTPGFGVFCGTSAAAPHAAAIGALVLEAAGGAGSLGPAALRTVLTATALDIEMPGPDRDAGAGIVMAVDAVAAVER